nr:ankyrin repeat-containing domain, PGG domain protein [Tanacetum cinerariifolium]
MLVETNLELLLAEDKEGHNIPLALSVSNMHMIKTWKCLFEHMKEKGYEDIKVVKMLVETNPELLLANNRVGHIPPALPVSNMHIKTWKCLFELMNEKGYH